MFAGEESVIAYKACLRMAQFIGRNPSRRQQVFDFMRITTVRSAIVHGGSDGDIAKRLTRHNSKGSRCGFLSVGDCARETDLFLEPACEKLFSRASLTYCSWTMTP